MVEYIERDSLAGKLIGMKCCCTLSKFDFGDVLRLINSEPTADVQEVRHGKWVYTSRSPEWADCKCSECGYTDLFSNDMECFYNYCPECGAKMDKE